MGGRGADEGVKEGVAGEEVGRETDTFHFLEELESEVGLVGVDVGGEGGVEDKFGEGGVGQWRRREWRVWRHWRRDLASKNL